MLLIGESVTHAIRTADFAPNCVIHQHPTTKDLVLARTVLGRSGGFTGKMNATQHYIWTLNVAYNYATLYDSLNKFRI